MPNCCLIFMLAVAALQGSGVSATATPDGKMSSGDGREHRDESKFITITSVNLEAPPGGDFTITVQVARPTSGDARKDREAAIRTFREAVADLEGLLNGGEFEGPAQKAFVERFLRDARKSLENILNHELKNPNKVFVLVFPGAKVPPRAQYTWQIPAAESNQIVIKVPPEGVDHYIVRIPAPTTPGPYTVILTPLDAVNVENAAIFGGSDTITVNVVAPASR